MAESDKYPHREIGERLRAIRRLTGLSAKDFAAECGFGETQYANWESGYRRPLPENAAVLVDKFGVTMDFIYLGRDITLPYNIRKELSSSPLKSGHKKSRGSSDS